MDESRITKFHDSYIPVTESGCWLWMAGATKAGYGAFISSKGKQERAHRLSYELHYGKFQKELSVLHKCDIPLCVNPAHLFLGTQKDNMDDKTAKGRARGASGEASAKSKLKNAQVDIIRERYANGETHQPSLAKEFGVSNSTISRIVTRKTRKS